MSTPAFVQVLVGVLLRARRELAEHRVPAVDQVHAGVGGHPAVRLQRGDELGERAGDLHAGGSAADDDDVAGPGARPTRASATRARWCRRRRSASATEYSGNACSSAPGMPKKFGRAPAASTRWSADSDRPSSSTSVRSASDADATPRGPTSTLGTSAKIVRSGRATSSAGSCDVATW